MTPIVILHGALGSAAQCALLGARLARDVRVRVLEFEGHGETPSLGRPYRIEHFADNVLAALDEANIECARFFGYSMGGYVALWLAHRQPHRVARVVTLGTKLQWTPELAEREVTMLDPAIIRAKVPKFADQLAERHVKTGWENVVRSTAEMMRWMGANAPLGENTLRAITQPVRIIVGDRDGTVSVAECVAARGWLPQGELEVLPATPHPLERAPIERLARTTLEFLE